MCDIIRSCIDCVSGTCNKMESCASDREKAYPSFCLTTGMEEDVKNEALSFYRDEKTKEIMIAAAQVEAEHYCKYTRVEEIIAFAEKINAKKLGIATCVGLLPESRTLAKILRSHGFEVYGVCCKTGAVAKTEVGIPESCESVGLNMCNPILQAKVLNEAETDLNLVVGLCVGHDSLFYKHSKALATTVVTKDRVLGHNPVAALYNAGTYYSKLLKK